METVTAIEVSSEIQTKVSGIERWSQEVAIASVQDRTTALEHLKVAKSWRKKVVEWFKESKEASDKAHKAIVAQESSLIKPIDVAEKIVKNKITAWDDEQERIRIAEQRKLQAIADEKARKERLRLEAQAAKLKTPELKAERLEMADEVVAPVVTVAPVEKVSGTAKSKIWKARVVDVSMVPREWMTVNESALNAFARSTKGVVPVAGVEFYAESNLSIRS